MPRARRKPKPVQPTPLAARPDGSVVVAQPVKGTSGRVTRSVAVRPGSFDWRFRGDLDDRDAARYTAGLTLAALMERAGYGGPTVAPPGHVRAGTPDARMLAVLDATKALATIERLIGKSSTARLRCYCGMGFTVREVWGAFGADRPPTERDERDMLARLMGDLDDLAKELPGGIGPY